MANLKKILDVVYQIGGSELSDPADCSIYLVRVGSDESVMVDCGAGDSYEHLIENIHSIGLKPEGLKALILTHCHIDHIGSAFEFKKHFDCDIIAHRLDADAIEGRDNKKTVASWYNIDYKPVTIDTVISGDLLKLPIGNVEFNFIHTPGHTPGSISVYCSLEGNGILFGQDIHGPFDPSFGSDINDWKKSMQKLLRLDADILCEGHFGVYQPKEEVKRYIEGYLSKY